MTHWFTWFFLAALFVVYMIGCVSGYDVGRNVVTLTKDSRDLRRVECDLADVKARLATLERVRHEHPGNEFLTMGIELTRFHHEKWDGSGYPRRLKGEEIPLFARVVGIADVAEAMLSHRPYRPAHSREEVLRELEEHQETLYDRRTAEICISLLLEGFSVSEETGNKY